MTIQELVDEMNRFVAAMDWYEEDSPWQQTPRNIAISLSLESSEVLEHFQWGERADKDTLAGELADVALYLLQLAYLTGIDLEQQFSINWQSTTTGTGPRSRGSENPRRQRPGGRSDL